MQYRSLDHFLSEGQAALAKGPIALILVEDDVEIDTTVRHHQQYRFSQVIVLMPPSFELARDVAGTVIRIDYDPDRDLALETAVNRMIDAAPGQWLYFCYNAEYLFYPFCETRSIGEMLGFHTEERRDAMLTYVVDLYAEDLDRYPNAVSLDQAHMDRSGYYALARPGDTI